MNWLKKQHFMNLTKFTSWISHLSEWKRNKFITNHIVYMILVFKKSFTCLMQTIFISFTLPCDVHVKVKTSGFSLDEVFKLTLYELMKYKNEREMN